MTVDRRRLIKEKGIYSIFATIFTKLICFVMKLNNYLLNTINNKERGHGQRSVVWLKRGQPCLRHLHVLSTAFSWRPLSLFSL